ncbi:Zn-ribbon domain-containing OB-fold protein [Nocardia rhamnosiphila]|uniref:Zn-ribbon domain-containing OB-fold protein n=1 Tax=Nocardia rhamnosiphila TaxID=426716 RepID=A0ABV2X0P5_9NOCA
MNQPTTESELPTPEPETEADNETFWRAAGEGRFVISRCVECAELVWIPRPFCPRCMAATEWVELSGRATIYSFTEVRRGDGVYAGTGPFVLAYVELAEGPRIMTNIVDNPVGELRIGQEVEVVFHVAGNGTGVPRFRPAQDESH